MTRQQKDIAGNQYVKIFFQLLQCIHHATILKKQTEGQFSKAFKNKIAQLNSFICPALFDDEIKSEILATNKTWATSMTSKIRNHYLKKITKLSKRAQDLKLPKHILNDVITKALYRARKQFGSKLHHATISEFQNMFQSVESQNNKPTTKTQNSASSTHKHDRFVRGYNDPLSNYFSAKFIFQNVTYNTVEQAFHHQKALYFDQFNIAKEVYNIQKPYQAKPLTSKIRKTTDWLNDRKRLMRSILRAKYDQVQSFRDELNRCKNMNLIHNIPDTFWGTGYGKQGDGLNKYGKILYEMVNNPTFAEIAASPKKCQPANNIEKPNCAENKPSKTSHTDNTNTEHADTRSKFQSSHASSSPKTDKKQHVKQTTTQVTNTTQKHSDRTLRSHKNTKTSNQLSKPENKTDQSNHSLNSLKISTTSSKTVSKNGGTNGDYKSSTKGNRIERTKQVKSHITHTAPNTSDRVLRSSSNTKTNKQTTKSVHPKSNYKHREWKIENIFSENLILGDSNLARIEISDIPTKTQIEAFPGAHMSHIKSIIEKYPDDKQKPKRIILSVGINDRKSPEFKSKTTFNHLISSIKHTFPQCEIAVCELNYSDGGLLDSEKNNLSSLNKHIISHKDVTNIPPIAESLFQTENDNIHWKRRTAKSMIKWWFKHLNY